MRGLTMAAAAWIAALVAGSPAHAANNWETGVTLYDTQCVSCHSLDPKTPGTGPSLLGVFGRLAGTAEGFVYSDALAMSGIVWDAETLSSYLANPQAFVPGTAKVIRLTNEGQRSDIVAYLAKLEAPPQPAAP